MRLRWRRGTLNYLVQNFVPYVGEVIVVEFANGLQPRHGLLGASGTGRNWSGSTLLFPKTPTAAWPGIPAREDEGGGDMAEFFHVCIRTATGCQRCIHTAAAWH